ncbi:MAG: hypothetical protein ABJB33_03995 [Gemmatimonadota bacterium]
MRSFAHPVLRRSILALAITQLVMCTLVPLHDATAATDKGPVRIERSHSVPGVPVHDPDTCPLCQLHSAPLLRPEETRVAPPTGTVQRPRDVSTTLPVARAPPAAHQTRAPPLLLA